MSKYINKAIIGILIIFLAVFMLVSFFAIKYPIKYKHEIESQSKNCGIDKEIILSIINIESGFREKAISSKGAIGLMQLLPDTANYMAEQNNLTYSSADLYVAEKNIKLGCLYLKYLLNKFDNLYLAVCAYNAGEGAVRDWLNTNIISNKNFNYENIPYKETKNYIRKFKNAFGIYKYKVAKSF